MSGQAGVEYALAGLEARWATHCMAGDAATREAFVDAAEASADLPFEALDAAVAAQPGRGAAVLALALHHGRQVERHRGTATADQVGRKDWQAIHRHQAAAAPLLRRAVELCFAPGMALSELMRNEQISGSRSAAERLFDEVLDVDPRWLPAWRRIQAVREPRWGGSVRDMDALLEQAGRHLSGEDVVALTAGHWWWRANYTATWEENPLGALPLVEKGLALAAPARTRAQLFDEKGAILSLLDRDAEAAMATREAVALVDDPQYCLNLARRLRWADQPDAAIEAYARGAALSGTAAYECALQLGNAFAYDSEAKGVARDRTRAVAAYERALELAQDDDARRRCLNCIGLEWSEVEPVEAARAEAAFSRGMALGDRYAANNLVTLLKHAPDTPATQQRINEALGVAGAGGNRGALRQLAERLERGVGGAGDPLRAAALWRQAALQGDTEALLRLAQDDRPQEARSATEVATWLAFAQGGPDMALARRLVNGLLEGRFGEAAPGFVRSVIVQLLEREERGDSDLVFSRVLLDYNLSPQADRRPKVLLAELRAIRKLVTGYLKAARSGKGDPDDVAFYRENEPRYRALLGEVEATIAAIPGRNVATRIGRRIVAPIRFAARLLSGKPRCPDLRRPGWR